MHPWLVCAAGGPLAPLGPIGFHDRPDDRGQWRQSDAAIGARRIIALIGFDIVLVMEWGERIILDPKVLTGKPVVRGTRMSVEFVVNLLANGWSERQIQDSYLKLTTTDIRACLAYASQLS